MLCPWHRQTLTMIEVGGCQKSRVQPSHLLADREWWRVDYLLETETVIMKGDAGRQLQNYCDGLSRSIATAFLVSFARSLHDEEDHVGRDFSKPCKGILVNPQGKDGGIMGLLVWVSNSGVYIMAGRVLRVLRHFLAAEVFGVTRMDATMGDLFE